MEPASRLTQACNNYFSPSKLWNQKNPSGKIKAIGAVTSYFTVVVPFFMKFLQVASKRHDTRTLKGKVSKSGDSLGQLKGKTGELAQSTLKNEEGSREAEIANLKAELAKKNEIIANLKGIKAEGSSKSPAVSNVKSKQASSTLKEADILRILSTHPDACGLTIMQLEKLSLFIESQLKLPQADQIKDFVQETYSGVVQLAIGTHLFNHKVDSEILDIFRANYRDGQGQVGFPSQFHEALRYMMLTDRIGFTYVSRNQHVVGIDPKINNTQHIPYELLEFKKLFLNKKSMVHADKFIQKHSSIILPDNTPKNLELIIKKIIHDRFNKKSLYFMGIEKRFETHPFEMQGTNSEQALQFMQESHLIKSWSKNDKNQYVITLDAP